MNHPSLARGGTRLTGVIDTLSAGYGVVNRHPWIVLIPILLDVFLWLGPQVSAARLLSRTLGQLALLGPRGAWHPEQAQIRDWVEAAESYNLLAGLAPSLVGVPSLIAALGIQDPLRAVPIESWTAAGAISLGALIGGMLLGSFYYAILAEQIRDGAVSPPRVFGQALQAWARVLGYLLLLAGLALLFGLPVVFLTASAMLVSPDLGSLALSAVLFGVLWVGLYLFFVPDAIFVSQVGPLQAVKNSVAVVRRSFWGAVGIVLLITVVLMGMGRVWELASAGIAQPWGLGLAIIGNAYIASGLIAASMRFYQERMDAVAGGQRPLARP